MNTRNPYNFVLASLIILIIPVFSFAGDKPDWVDGENFHYPEKQYLKGVGFGSTRELAENNAYSAVSKIFSADISSVHKDYQRYLQNDSIDKTSTENRINIEQLTEIKTNRALENIIIAETWHDDKENVYYVLAVIDRSKAGNSLEEKILSLDSQIDDIILKSRGDSNKISKLRGLKDIIRKLIQREAYNSDLRVLHISGKGIESPVSLGEKINELDSFLKNDFTVAVEIAGEKGEDVRLAIVERLTETGLAVIKSEKDSDLLVKGEVEFKEAFINKPKFKFITWTIDLKLVYQDTDKVIGGITKSGREAHYTVSEAKEKALKALQKEIADPVNKKIADFLYGS